MAAIYSTVEDLLDAAVEILFIIAWTAKQTSTGLPGNVPL